MEYNRRDIGWLEARLFYLLPYLFDIKIKKPILSVLYRLFGKKYELPYE